MPFRLPVCDGVSAFAGGVALIAVSALMFPAPLFAHVGVQHEVPIETRHDRDGAIELQLLSPDKLSQHDARTLLLDRARRLTAEARAVCFRIRRETWNNDARVIWLRSGRMIVEVGEGTAEWNRYWRLQRHRFGRPSDFRTAMPHRLRYRLGRMTIELLQVRATGAERDIVCA